MKNESENGKTGYKIAIVVIIVSMLLVLLDSYIKKDE